MAGRVVERGGEPLVAPRHWVGSVLVLATGNGIGQALAALGAVAVVAFYRPADVGAAATFAAFVGIAGVLSTFRYELMLPVVEPEHLADATALCAVAVVASAVVAEFVAVVAGPWAIDHLGAPHSLLVLRYAAGPAVGALGWTTILAQLATRDRDYPSVAASSVAQGATLAAGQVALGVPGTGAAGLVVASVASTGAGAIVLHRRGRRVQLAPCRQWRDLARLARRYRHLPTFASWSTACQAMLAIGLPAVVAMTYGLRAAGLVALAQRVLAAPSRVVSDAASRAFLGDAAELARRSPAAVRGRLVETVRLLAVAAAVPAVLLMAVAVPVGNLLGGRWAPVGIDVAVLVPFFFLQFVVFPVNQALLVVDRLPVQAALASLRAGLSLGSLLLVHAAGGSATYALLAYSLGGATAYGLALVAIDREVAAWPAARALQPVAA